MNSSYFVLRNHNETLKTEKRLLKLEVFTSKPIYTWCSGTNSHSCSPQLSEQQLAVFSASLRPELKVLSADLYHLRSRRRSLQRTQHGMDTTHLCHQHSTVSNLPGQWINPHVSEVMFQKADVMSNLKKEHSLNLQKRFWDAQCEMLLAALVPMEGTLRFPQGTTRAIPHWQSGINLYFQSSGNVFPPNQKTCCGTSKQPARPIAKGLG